MKRVLQAVLAAALVCTAQLGHAADYPTRTVRVIVPYAAGGAADFLGRVFADQLSKRLGQPFVVENRAGGGGVLGTESVVRAEPDGYTLLVSGFPSHIIAPRMNPNARYDALRDFTHIAYFGGPPNVVVVHPSFGAKNFADFMTKVKSSAQPIEYVSPGVGTTGNMVGELFKLKGGVNMLHVGYRGGGAAILDLLAGHVKVGSMTLSTTIQHIRAGNLIPLALSSAKRVADLPDVPTFTELGYPEIVSTTWFALSGPTGLPQEVVNKLNKAVVASLGDQDVEKRLAQEEVQVEPMTPVAITKFMESERSRWEPVLKVVGEHN